MKLLTRLVKLLAPKSAPKVLRRFPLEPKGTHYDLQEIYEKLNQHYFSGKLDLKITWCGHGERRARRSRRLGLYCFRTKSVKIHRLLDSAHFPSYFISFVVYHEMLHSVLPPVKNDKKGRRIHHDAFKKKEREFEDYAGVKQWEKENKKLFFN